MPDARPLTLSQLFFFGVLLFALNETSNHTTLGHMYNKMSSGVMGYGNYGKRATTMF
jgi:hypothetical protein